MNRATLLGLAAVGLWSTVATAFKLSLRVMSPLELVCWASVFSALALGLILARRGQLRAALAMSRRDAGRAALLGLLNPALYYLVLFQAYDLLPAQEAQPLNYTWAVVLALLSGPVLGQRITGRDILSALVSLAGVLVISTRGNLAGLHFASPLGVALALGSTLLWALYWLLSIKDDREPVAGLLQNFLFGSGYLIVLALASGVGLPADPRALLGAAYVGCFEMGLTFVLWLEALRAADNAAMVGNLIFLSPLLSLVLIHLLLGEAIQSSTLAGLGLILAAQAIQRLRRIN